MKLPCLALAATLTSFCNSFPIVVVALLLAGVFARLAHRVCCATATADPLVSWSHDTRNSLLQVTGEACPLVVAFKTASCSIFVPSDCWLTVCAASLVVGEEYSAAELLWMLDGIVAFDQLLLCQNVGPQALIQGHVTWWKQIDTEAVKLYSKRRNPLRAGVTNTVPTQIYLTNSVALLQV